MFFCPKCNNSLNFGTIQQSGGATTLSSDDIIGIILNKAPLSFDDVNKAGGIDAIVSSPQYKKLKVKQKEYVFNKLQDIVPDDQKMYDNPDEINKPNNVLFVCNNCGYTEPVKPGTMIFNKSSADISQNYTTSDYKNMLYSNILPFTRNYTCPNDKCDSHKDSMKREATFFRLNNTFKVKYICRACETEF